MLFIALGGPLWYSSVDSSDGSLNGFYQDYAQRSCYAIPTCNESSEECMEGGGYSIQARAMPTSPQFTAATYPTVSTPDRFSKDSIEISIEEISAPLSGGGGVDKYRIEWSLESSFSKTNSHVTTSPNYIISSLFMGTIYYVRVTAHNSAGYGIPSHSVPVKPMQSPDPPFSPTLSLISSTITSYPETGTSLRVEWSPPIIDNHGNRPDDVGDGGDGIIGYLVEWSKVNWDIFQPTIWEMKLDDSTFTGGAIVGSFRLKLDTTQLATAVVPGIYSSARISVDASPSDIKVILENMPNVGEVAVSLTAPKTWSIEFLSEVGDITGLAVDSSDIYDSGTFVHGSVSLSKLTQGSLPTPADYKFSLIDASLLPSLSFDIVDLIPGIIYYVRVAARNRMGISRRRVTAPRSIVPPVQKPGTPVSYFHPHGNPTLRVASDSSLSVHIGPPSFDGGSMLTNFLVEWDTSALFNSNSNGSAMGFAHSDAVTNLCMSCVTSFDAETNTFTWNGSADMMKGLVTQRMISVYFSDEHYTYLFSVESVTTATEITVSNFHNRLTSLTSMNSENGNVGATSLHLLGSEYAIVGLEEGSRYYVRVSGKL